MDTGFFKQALQEIGKGLGFEQLSAAQQSAVMQRAQALKMESGQPKSHGLYR